MLKNIPYLIDEWKETVMPVVQLNQHFQNVGILEYFKKSLALLEAVTMFHLVMNVLEQQ